MLFQLENKALWESTEWSQDPGSQEHRLGPSGVGYVGDREHDG